MKLFRKTLLFFAGAVVFQTALTILLITAITRRANLADAQRELDEEASVLYEGLNSWKRQMWISINQIAGDPQLARPTTGNRTRSLSEILLATKADALVIRGDHGMIDVAQSPPGSWTASDLEGLANAKSHPYIELVRLGGSLCIVAAASLASQPREDVFLLKRLDAEFCAQLTLNRRSRIALLLGAEPLVSTLPVEATISFFDPAAMHSAYRELYDRRVGRESYNAAFQRIGRLGQAEDGPELFLGTFLTNEPFDRKLLELNRTVLLVSLAGALFTIVLSLYFSRNITYPIAELASAMRRIRDRARDTRVGIRGGHEISGLFRGFNDMARELDEHIREIVLLRDYNEKIIDSIRAGIAIINGELLVEKANRGFREAFGLTGDRVTGVPFTALGIDFVDDTFVAQIRSILSRDRMWHSELKRSRFGRVYEVRLYPFYSAEGGLREASGCVLMVDDVSEKTELEQKIYQAEKLSSISMLSAGMAHEVNNPLGSILTNAQNLLAEEADPERRISLSFIEQETRRIARIVQELLDFACADSGHARGADVNAVVRDVVRVASHAVLRDRSIRIDTRLTRDLPATAVSSDELKQAVLNLVANSIQAIEATGRILVSTHGSRAGDRVSVAVSDNGCGIPDSIASRIFDPFFTTKPNGEGTGLGLSVVYGIVTKYNGTIDVKSREGMGTRVLLKLPTLDPGGAR